MAVLTSRIRSRGFSLVELLVALMLVLLLISAAGLYFAGVSHDAQQAIVAADLQTIRGEVDRYLLTPGRTMPDSVFRLKLAPDRSMDPWGTPYRIDDSPPRVMSAGPDRTFDTPPRSARTLGDDVALELAPPRSTPVVAASRPATVHLLRPVPRTNPRPDPWPCESPAPASPGPPPPPPPQVVVTIIPDFTLFKPPTPASNPPAEPPPGSGAPPIVTTDAYCMRCHVPKQPDGHSGDGQHDHDHCCPGQTGRPPPPSSGPPSGIILRHSGLRASIR